jgi:hypothetical protein
LMTTGRSFSCCWLEAPYGGSGSCRPPPSR